MIDGPYIFERDIVGGLKDGKGTFFLNVSLPPSCIFWSYSRGKLMDRVRIMIVSIIMLMIFDIWIHCMSKSSLYLVFLHVISFSSFSSFLSFKNSFFSRSTTRVGGRLMIRGHTIASHTWSHTDMTTLSYEQLHDELAKVEQALIRILGKKPLYVCPCLLPLLSTISSRVG